jgi:DNA-binding Lrp family transcriptional regulator
MSLSPLAVIGISRYHRPTEGFTIIRDSFLRNAQTSLRAFRVGAYVLSHATGFIQTQRQIARACNLSVTTVRAALEDLKRDRYVARRVIREAGRIVGTAYAVSDRPFTEAELAQLCPPCTESEHTESVHTGSVPPKKTTPARETTSGEKTTPSGGSLRESDRPSTEEDEPMPPTQDPALPLEFAQALPRQNGKSHAGTSAQDVVAAFVDSYRRHHSGGDPLKGAKGRVARDAAQLLRAGRAGVPELVKAATAMGATPFCNLGVQLDMVRDPRAVARIAPVAPKGSFDVAHRAARLKFIADLHDDQELATWVAEDPAEVAKLVSEDPTLESVFAAVSAA